MNGGGREAEIEFDLNGKRPPLDLRTNPWTTAGHGIPKQKFTRKKKRLTVHSRTLPPYFAKKKWLQ